MLGYFDCISSGNGIRDSEYCKCTLLLSTHLLIVFLTVDYKKLEEMSPSESLRICKFAKAVVEYHKGNVKSALRNALLTLQCDACALYIPTHTNANLKLLCS